MDQHAKEKLTQGAAQHWPVQTSEVISKPGATFQVRVVPMDVRIREAISKALAVGKTSVKR